MLRTTAVIMSTSAEETAGATSYFNIEFVCAAHSADKCSTESMTYLSSNCDTKVQDSVPLNGELNLTEVVPFWLTYLDKQDLQVQYASEAASAASSSGSSSNFTFTGNGTVLNGIAYVDTTFDQASVYRGGYYNNPNRGGQNHEQHQQGSSQNFPEDRGAGPGARF